MAENQGALAPHAAVIQISYEVYEQHPNGQFHPNKKADGRSLLVLKGSDYAVCLNRVQNFLNEVQKEYEYETRSQAEEVGGSQVAGIGGTQSQSTKMLGVRNGFAGRAGD
jgi:hypothetical protein